MTAPSAAKQAEPAAAASAPDVESGAKSGKRTASRKTSGKFSVVDGSPGLRAIVARHAAAQGVPFALADAVVRVESRYNPSASSKGNYGLMQIRHQTARGLGYSGSAAGLLNAETNAKYGMMYLAQAYRMTGGDTCRTVMKYQSGHMATQMSSANRAYCAKVRTYVASL
ncbi:MAG: lytic transglycosylase domain-containing protein [Bosea sp. (in: a-proteobacteria)]